MIGGICMPKKNALSAGAPRASDNHMGSSGAAITCSIIVEVSIDAAAMGYPVDKFYRRLMVE
jgi:hypothetical protein